MGKKLIIKNANYAENAIDGGNIPTLLSLLTPLVIGNQWAVTSLSPQTSHNKPTLASTSNTARAATDTIVNISLWATSIGTVNLSPKTGYKIAAYFGNNGTSDNIIEWGYTTAGNTLTVNLSTVTYALVMVASTDDSTLTSTDWEDYVEET